MDISDENLQKKQQFEQLYNQQLKEKQDKLINKQIKNELDKDPLELMQTIKQTY